jgi:hypothetical protein
MEKKIKQSDFDRLVRRQILRAMKLGYTPDEVVETILRVTEQGFETPIDQRRPIEEVTHPRAVFKGVRQTGYRGGRVQH